MLYAVYYLYYSAKRKVSKLLNKSYDFKYFLKLQRDGIATYFTRPTAVRM